MQELENKIKKDGQVLPGDVLKVGSFLNQQLDVDFLMEMGAEIARLFKGDDVTKILTIESSGIAIAVTAAASMHVPVVFAKKHVSSNVSGECYSVPIHSFTHGNTYNATVSKEYLSPEDRVLIVDDFLARGNAIRGLAGMVKEAGASLVGCAIAVEKGFQGAGDALRSEGIRVESLAIIDRMTDDGDIEFRR